MISDHSDHAAIKGTDESLSRVDSSVPLMYHDPNDLRSEIRFKIFPKKRTLYNSSFSFKVISFFDLTHIFVTTAWLHNDDGSLLNSFGYLMDVG